MSDAILRFCRSFGISHIVSAAYHPQINGKAEKVIQTLKGCIRKLKATSREEWGRVLQLAVSSYWTVPHGSTGMSPCLMLYGREALKPEEIPHVTYSSNDSYEVAVEKHIKRC